MNKDYHKLLTSRFGKELAKRINENDTSKISYYNIAKSLTKTFKLEILSGHGFFEVFQKMGVVFESHSGRKKHTEMKFKDFLSNSKLKKKFERDKKLCIKYLKSEDTIFKAEKIKTDYLNNGYFFILSEKEGLVPDTENFFPMGYMYDNLQSDLISIFAIRSDIPKRILRKEIDQLYKISKDRKSLTMPKYFYIRDWSERAKRKSLKIPERTPEMLDQIRKDAINDLKNSRMSKNRIAQKLSNKYPHYSQATIRRYITDWTK